MWTLSAITVLTNFCLRYTKDKERFEELFIFRISKKAVDLYIKQMLRGHFSQNILVSYVKPCFKWFSGNVFFIRFHIRPKIEDIFLKDGEFRQQLFFKYYFLTATMLKLLEICQYRRMKNGQEHSLGKKTEFPHMFWSNIPQTSQSYISEPETPKITCSSELPTSGTQNETKKRDRWMKQRH